MDIIYQDQRILVLNKPPGITTTNENRRESQTVEQWLLKFLWSKKVKRSGICHRLDKDTSGILLVAKDQETVGKIKKQFKDREVKKTYLALVGGLTTKQGEIRVPIGRSKIFGKWTVKIEGREAVTSFTRLAIYEDEFGKKYSFLELKPKTGRTHQIRVHCAYMGWPLVGDSRYGGNANLILRQFLHASEIEIFHPETSNFMKFESKLPKDLTEVLDKLVKIQ